MGSFRSSPFVRVTLVNLQYALRYPRSEPNCMTRPVSEHDQPHIRSPFMTAAPTSRLRRARARKTRTILESGVFSHGLLWFVHLDPPGLIKSRQTTDRSLVCSCQGRPPHPSDLHTLFTHFP